MTTADSSRPSDPNAVPASTSRYWSEFERLLGLISEYLNPIVVKESRQALKSWQFLITFFLSLFAGWCWSLAGVASMMPGIYYSPGGTVMLVGYFWILAFPLLVVVPFAAFWSLAAERIDGTYELLSISTLSPRLIVRGKLCSAMVQMLVYLSALSPCLVFTYLLRGVDILTIVLLIVYAFLASLLLSMFALLLATLALYRAGQAVLAVALIITVSNVFMFCGVWGTMIIAGEAVLPYHDPMLWIGQATCLCFYFVIFALIYLAAAACLTFPSENRSTTLRIAMQVMQFFLVAWFIYYMVEHSDTDVMGGFITASTAFWYIMGIFIVGESGQLSARTKRSLPQSFAGRLFLSWFNPGPGTGYFFVVSNVIAAMIVTYLAMLGGELAGGMGGFDEDIVWAAPVMTCYLISYLGVGRLLMALLRRTSATRIFLSAVVNVVLVALGTIMPLILQLFILFDDDYTPLQITNPFWSTVEVADSSTYRLVITVVVVLFSGLVIVANMAMTIKEVRHDKAAAPDRVVEDELELHPPKIEEPKPTSPWDE